VGERNRETINRVEANIRHRTFYYRLVIYWASKAYTLNEETSLSYDVQEFQHNPGIYFEKMGRLHYARETWKLVIKLDLATLTIRYNQIMDYLQEAKVICTEPNFFTGM